MREWDESLLLSYEKDALGFYITGHPLAQFEKRLRLLVSHSLGQLDEEKDFNNEIRVAGIIGAVKPLKTKKDERIVSFVLEDLSGRIEVVAFPESYKKYFECSPRGEPGLAQGPVHGRGREQADQPDRDHAARPTPSRNRPSGSSSGSSCRGWRRASSRSSRKSLEKSPGECPVFFELETPHAYRVLAQSIEVRSVAPTDELVRSVEQLLGEGTVSDSVLTRPFD